MADKTVRIRGLDDTISRYPVEAIHSYGVELHFGRHTHVIVPWHRVVDITWIERAD